MAHTILIVEDEPKIAELLRIVLEREQVGRIAWAETAAAGLEIAREQRPDLVVLDIMLPDGDGFEVAAALRAFTDAPIIFLTARDSDADKLMGFGMGGDDYVTKPFNPLEVVARIKAHLRRASGGGGFSSAIDLGRVVIDEDAARVAVDGNEVVMPAREMKLLAFLARNADRVFSARQLYRQVWAEEPLGPTDDNTVTVHIRRIREKVERDPSAPELIVTVRGLGYKLVRPPAEGAGADTDDASVDDGSAADGVVEGERS